MIRRMSDLPERDSPPSPPRTPAGPAPWAAPDRPRGLDAYFAPGGEDDAPQARRDDERRMLRLLVIFVALLVGIPTLLTILGLLATITGTASPA